MVQERLRNQVIFALKICQFLCICGVKVEKRIEERPALFPFYICTRFDENKRQIQAQKKPTFLG